MKKTIERYLLASLGMACISAGVAFIAETRIGADSITLLFQALFNNFGLTIGTWSTIIGIVCLTVTLFCDRRKIGYSTFFYVIVGQYIIDGVMYLLPTPNCLFIDVIYALIGILIVSIGSALGVGTRLGLSYFDGFCFSVTDRFHLNYVVFRYVVEGSVIVACILLHTYPNIGTIVYLVAFAPCVNFFIKLTKAKIRTYFGLEIEY